MMSILKSNDTVIPFEELIIEMYENKDDEEHLLALDNYIVRFKKEYCLVHLYTLKAALGGYIGKVV